MLDMHGLRWHGALVLEAWRRGRLHRASRVMHLGRSSPVLHGRGLGPPRHSLVLVLVVAIARARTAPVRFQPRLRLVLLLWWLILWLLMLLRLSLRRLMLLRLPLLMLLLLTLWLLLMLSLRLLSLILLPLLVLALVAPQAIVVIVSERLPGSEPK
jgi:hypothetical protein